MAFIGLRGSVLRTQFAQGLYRSRILVRSRCAQTRPDSIQDTLVFSSRERDQCLNGYRIAGFGSFAQGIRRHEPQRLLVVIRRNGCQGVDCSGIPTLRRRL